MLLFALIAIVLIVGTDQLIKVWIVGNFALYEERPFLKIGSLDIMHLHYILNDGSAFSSFAGKTAFLIAISGIGIAVCVYFLVKKAQKRPFLFWCLTAVIGGAVGNFIDRIFRGGSVVDYFDVQLFHFAIFNFADCFITVGTALLAVYILFFMEKDDKRLKAAAPAPTEETHDDT